MDTFINAINTVISNPFPYINFCIAIVAMIGVIYFGAGFFAGMPNLFTLSAHSDHLAHYNMWIVRGFMIVFYTFMLWELMRLIEGWFGYGTPPDPQTVLNLYIAYGLVLVILWVLFKLKSAVTDRGGH